MASLDFRTPCDLWIQGHRQMAIRTQYWLGMHLVFEFTGEALYLLMIYCTLPPSSKLIALLALHSAWTSPCAVPGPTEETAYSIGKR